MPCILTLWQLTIPQLENGFGYPQKGKTAHELRFGHVSTPSSGDHTHHQNHHSFWYVTSLILLRPRNIFIHIPYVFEDEYHTENMWKYEESVWHPIASIHLPPPKKHSKSPSRVTLLFQPLVSSPVATGSNSSTLEPLVTYQIFVKMKVV